MKQEVNGIELLQLIHNKKINTGEKIYSKKLNTELYWSGKNLENDYFVYLKQFNDISFIEDTFVLNIELSADELFEELGFIKTVENNDLIEYDCDFSNIYFNKKEKTFKKNADIAISIEENKAINKKMEELGWLQ